MKASLLAAALLALAAPASAQEHSVSVPASADALARLSVHTAETQSIAFPAVPGRRIDVPVEIDGIESALVLEPVSLRSVDFRLIAVGANGVSRDVEPAPPATYRGFLRGFPESTVAGSLVDGGFRGVFRLSPGETLRGIQPLSEVDASAAPLLHVLYDARDAYSDGSTCGTDSEAAGAPGAPEEGGSGGGLEDQVVCQIACDADFQFFQLKGSSVANTQQDIENVINGVQVIYENDVDIVYEITAIVVQTEEPDPYTATDPSVALNQFRVHWNQAHDDIERDVAHLFTGKNLDGSVIGIASLSVICNLPSAYGLSQSTQFSFTSRVGLTAHELGHNWAAFHCNSDSDCKIMCSGLGGCTGILTSFGSSSVASILGKKNSVNCLAGVLPPPPPVLTSVLPLAGVQALEPGTVTLIGSSFETVHTVNVAGVPKSKPFFKVVSDTKITFTPTTAPALGATSVSVVNQTGVSNAGAFEYAPNDPPLLLVPFSVPNGQTLSWTYAAGPFEAGLLVLSANSATFPFEGFDVLLNGFLLHSQFLDAVGLGQFAVQLPALVPGTVLYTQLVTFDGLVFGGSDVRISVIGF